MILALLVIDQNAHLSLLKAEQLLGPPEDYV